MRTVASEGADGRARADLRHESLYGVTLGRCLARRLIVQATGGGDPISTPSRKDSDRMCGTTVIRMQSWLQKVRQPRAQNARQAPAQQLGQRRLTIPRLS